MKIPFLNAMSPESAIKLGRRAIVLVSGAAGGEVTQLFFGEPRASVVSGICLAAMLHSSLNPSGDV